MARRTAGPTPSVPFMDRALLLAERGRGRTTPNPIVGAVVVSSDGVVVGQGAHIQAGGPHAEVLALEAAGPRARGATLYCTLEPCTHVGRTGPCVERIVASGIARVVASVRDPNPRVSGRGFDYLRAHGIAVEVGTGADRARRQNAAFFTWAVQRRPFVILKSAVSADGFVGRRGPRVKLTGPIADRWFQRQRAEIDALAVGSGTMLADDPLLTARDVYRHRPLTRVIFDRRGRVPPTARVFSTLTAGPVIMVGTPREAIEHRRNRPEARPDPDGVEYWDQPDLASVMAGLAEREIVSLLVEGGPELQSAFAEAHLVDRVQRLTTPHVLGEGITAAGIVSAQPSGEAARVASLGQDTLTEFDVHWTD